MATVIRILEIQSNRDAPGGYPSLASDRSLSLYNAAGTFRTALVASATAPRICTIPDRDLTLADAQDIGTLPLLATTDKSNLVAAINEVRATGLNAGKLLGELFFLDEYLPPSADFPALCLNAADQTITDTQWPELQPWLYARPLRYDPCGVNAIDFPVESYAIASNILTWTLTNTAANRAIVAALAEDQQVHGSYSNWLTCTNESAILSIPAGTRAITNVSAAARQIDVPYVGAFTTTTYTSGILRIYRHRIAGSTTTARQWQAVGRGFVTAGDTASEWIGGLRRRDRMQGHRHVFNRNIDYISTGATGTGTNNAPFATDTTPQIGDPITDDTHGTPRIGATTDTRGLAVFAYRWGRRHTA